MPSRYPCAREIAIHCGGDGKPNGAGWLEAPRCPGCGKKFAVKDRTDGKAGWPILKCWHECDGKAIIAALKAEGFGPGRGGGRISATKARREPQSEAADAKRSPAERFHKALLLDAKAPLPYLLARGIDSVRFPDLDKTLRFEPYAWKDEGGRWGPALAAALTDNSGGIKAVQRTYLAGDGTAKRAQEPRRRTQGPRKGAAVRLGEPSEKIMLTEELEDAMTIMLAFDMSVSAFAVCGKEFKAFVPPKTVKEIIIAADRDKDGGGLKAAQEAAKVFAARGLKAGVALPPEGEGAHGKPIKDFNDLVRGKSGEASAEGFATVKAAIEAAEQLLAEAGAPTESEAAANGRDLDAEREAIVKLGEGDIAAFVERAKSDPGFPFEPEAISALYGFARRRGADFERLRARMRAETKVRLPALEAAMRVGSSGDVIGDGLPGSPIEFDEAEPWPEPVDGAQLLDELSETIGSYVVMDRHQRELGRAVGDPRTCARFARHLAPARRQVARHAQRQDQAPRNAGAARPAPAPGERNHRLVSGTDDRGASPDAAHRRV